MPFDPTPYTVKKNNLKEQFDHNQNQLENQQYQALQAAKKDYEWQQAKNLAEYQRRVKNLTELIEATTGRKQEQYQDELEKLTIAYQADKTKKQNEYDTYVKNINQSYKEQGDQLQETYAHELNQVNLDESNTKAAYEEEERKKKKPPPEGIIITRIPYPKWWRDSLNAKIDLTAPGSAILATVSGNLRLFVATIVLTVTGETAISFQFGNAGSSGPIYLGGTDQPMGIVVAMGNSPAPCGDGNLVITATDPGAATPSIGGWATCFAEEIIKQKA